MKSLSVIIPYYGAGIEVMRKHIISCINNTERPEEIIIINDGHTTDLSSFCYEFSEQIPMVYAKILIDIPWNVSNAMNLAWWICQTEFASVEDCDIIPHEDYYRKALQVLQRNKYHRFIAHYDNVEAYPAACSVYQRKMMIDLGGYDEDFAGHYGFDDILLNAKMDKAGYKRYISKEQLLSVDFAGESKADRDSSHNYKLMMKKINNPKPNLNILRQPYTIQRF